MLRIAPQYIYKNLCFPTYAVPAKYRKRFRQYRDLLLKTIVAERKAAVNAMNLGEGKTDEIKGAGMFGSVELDMHIDSGKEMEDSTKLELAQEWVELAHIAAKCLYETPNSYGAMYGNLPLKMIADRIDSLGSAMLKQYWQTKSKTASVIRDRYTYAVPGTRRKLFRECRDKLLATMVAGGKADDNDMNVDEERVIRTPRSDKSVDRDDGEQTSNIDGNADKGQENRIDNDDKKRMPIYPSKENELNASDNHFRLVPAAKAQSAKRAVAGTKRPNGVTFDGILNRSKSGDEGALPASPSLPVDSPSTMPPDLKELARLVTECMGANSNKICHTMLAGKVLSSECQMLKDRWNGMASLSRFQRDGYLMLIPRFMRKEFYIHLMSSLNMSSQDRA